MDNISLSDQDVAERARAADDGRSPDSPSATVARAGGLRCRSDLSGRGRRAGLARPPTAGRRRRRRRRKSP